LEAGKQENEQRTNTLYSEIDSVYQSMEDSDSERKKLLEQAA